MTLNIFNHKITHFELDEDSNTSFESDEVSSIVEEIMGQTIITNHLQEETLLVYQV